MKTLLLKKTIELGKIPYTNPKRKSNLATLEVEIRKVQNKKLNQNLESVEEYYTLSISGNIWNSRKSDIVCGGQCMEDLNKYKRFYGEKAKIFSLLFDAWMLFHLNDMKAGTTLQEISVKKYLAESGKRYDYTEVCEYLKSENLYEDRGYRYGTAWLVDTSFNQEQAENLIKILNNLETLVDIDIDIV